MYRPSYTVNANRELALDLIRDCPLGLLISNSKGKIEANYLPFLTVQENQETFLVSHIAKANRQWKTLDDNVLISFQGPNRYISPTIYTSNLNVPTWSYAAVQVHGAVEIISDKIGLGKILEQTVEAFEARNNTNWSYNLPVQMQEKLEKAIVGIKMKIARIEAKFKLSQNRDSDDYNAVLDFLSDSEKQKDRELSKWMMKTKI